MGIFHKKSTPKKSGCPNAKVNEILLYSQHERQNAKLFFIIFREMDPQIALFQAYTEGS
jgi:hypothetical protein